jgi:hypothetical protein
LAKAGTRSSIIPFVVAGVVLGGVVLRSVWLVPAYSHGEIDALREIETARGPMLLATESVGRSAFSVVTRRTSMIDPRTLQRVTRVFGSDCDSYLGETKSNDVLWFAPRKTSPDRFTARDPVTLALLVSSQDLIKQHPKELGIGIHEFRFDSGRSGMWVLANDNRSYLITRAGATFAVVPVDGPPRAAAYPNAVALKLSSSLALIDPKWIDLHSAKNGKLIQLDDPAGGLVASRATLLPKADIILTRTDAEGAAVWSRPFANQQSILKAYRYDDRLLVVSRGGLGDGNDWLTAIDAAHGATLTRYQF